MRFPKKKRDLCNVCPHHSSETQSHNNRNELNLRSGVHRAVVVHGAQASTTLPRTLQLIVVKRSNTKLHRTKAEADQLSRQTRNTFHKSRQTTNTNTPQRPLPPPNMHRPRHAPDCMKHRLEPARHTRSAIRDRIMIVVQAVRARCSVQCGVCGRNALHCDLLSSMVVGGVFAIQVAIRARVVVCFQKRQFGW